jgi:hypothetical protein
MNDDYHMISEVTNTVMAHKNVDIKGNAHDAFLE